MNFENMLQKTKFDEVMLITVVVIMKHICLVWRIKESLIQSRVLTNVSSELHIRSPHPFYVSALNKRV